MRRLTLCRIAILSAALCAMLLARSAPAGPLDQTSPPATRRVAEFDDWREIDLKLAKVKLELAKKELAVLLEANQRTPAAVSESDLEKGKSAVEHAAMRLQDIQANAYSDRDLAYAKAVVAVADSELQVSLRANDSAPGAVTEIDIERLRLTVLAARLQVEKIKAASAAESRLADMQTELADLRKEVASLRKNVESVLPKAKVPAEGQ